MRSAPEAADCRLDTVSGETFRRVLEACPEAVFIVDGAGRIDLVNGHSAHLFGYARDELLGQSLEVLVPERRRAAHAEHRRAFLKSPTIRAMAAEREFRCRRKDGSKFPAQISLYPLDARGWTVCTVRDLTPHKRVEAVLHESEERFRVLCDNAPVAISLKRSDGRYYLVNKHFEMLAGASIELIKGKTSHEIFDEAAADQCLAHDREILAMGSASTREEVFDTEDGPCTLLTVKFPIKDRAGKVTAIGAIHTDITDRKRSEETMRRLATELERAREAERTLVARDIHDDLGQILTGLKMELDWVTGRLPGGGDELRERLRAMGSLIDGGIDSVRRITSSLRPAVLDDLGLAAAVEWMTRESEQRIGIRCRLTLAEGASTGCPERDTAVFRIFEEALTNVARHAVARRVSVRLACTEEALELEVSDDGAGIEAEALRSPRSVGLAGMRARAASWGGELVIEPGAAGGTVVRLRMPLAERPSSGGETA